MPYTAGLFAVEVTVQHPSRLLAPAHSLHSSTLHCPGVHSYSTAALTPSAGVRVLLASSILEIFCLGPPLTRT